MSTIPHAETSPELGHQPLDVNPEGSQQSQEHMLKLALTYAHALLENFGTAIVDDIAAVREYTWQGDSGLIYTLEERGMPGMDEQTLRWQSPLVVSVSQRRAVEGTYLTRIDITPDSMQTQTPYTESKVLGETDDASLGVIVGELWSRSRLENAKPIADNSRRRLAIVGNMLGQQQGDGWRSSVVADLGTDEHGRNFKITYLNTQLDELGDMLPELLVISTAEDEQKFRMHPFGRMHGLVGKAQHEPERGVEERAEIDQALAQLDTHLDELMEQGQYSAPLRYRVAMIMDRVAARRESGDSSVKVFASTETRRLGEHEVDFRLHDTDSRYVINLWVASPDGEEPHNRRVIIPKDRRQPVEFDDADDLELATAAIDQEQEQLPDADPAGPTVERYSGPHPLLDALDEVIAQNRARIPVVWGRDPHEPQATRREWTHIEGDNRLVYHVERLGRLGTSGQIEILLTRVHVDDEVYVVEDGRLVPETPTNGGRFQKNLQRKRTEQATSGFGRALLTAIRDGSTREAPSTLASGAF